MGIVNLEGPAGEAPFSEVKGERVRLASDPKAVAALAALGVEVVGLANNHRADRGDDGEQRTRAILEAAGMHSPLAAPLELHGWHIAAVELPSRARAPSDLTERLVAGSAPSQDPLAVSFHVTGPPSYIPQPALREAVALAVAAGARVIVAHGTHVLGPVERRRGPRGEVVIAWGLGNLLFSCSCTTSREGAILRARVEGERVVVSVLALDAGLMGEPARLAADPGLAFDVLEAIGSPKLERRGEAALF